MRVNISVDCSPEEARAFLGLPNVQPVNELLVNRVSRAMETNMDMLDPGELIKSWMSFGGAMQEQFLQAMTMAADAAGGASEGGSPTAKKKPRARA